MKKFLIMVCFAISCFFVYTLNTNAATNTSFRTDYYWYNPYTGAGQWTGYRTGSNNYVVIWGGRTATNYNNYNLEVLRSISNQWDNISLIKDNIYSFYYTVKFFDIQSSEVQNLDFINDSTNFYISSNNGQIISSSLVSNSWEYTGIKEVDYNPVEVGVQTAEFKFSIKATKSSDNLNLTLTKNLDDYFVGKHIADITVRVVSSEYELVTDMAMLNKQDQIISQQEKTNEKLDKTNQELGKLNDNLNDDNTSGASSEASEFFSGFETDTFGLTSIITAPLNLIGSITSSSCSPLGLEVPFVDSTLNLPCMTSIYEEYFGGFLTVYQTITFGIIAYWVCVRIFALVKDFKNPDHDEIEVMDL